MDQEGTNVVQSALAAAQNPRVEQFEGRPVLIAPHGWALHDMESKLGAPTRRTGSVTLTDRDSFIAHVNRHKSERAVIYCLAEFGKGEVSLTAVLNDHGPESPGWRDWRAVYAVKQSEEWKRWSATDRKAQPQVAYALFLEDNIKDVATVDGMPTGTQMLELALKFEATQDSRFKSTIRLQSGGVDMAYVNTDDEATVLKMQVFDRFALGIAPFFNGSPYQLNARLRYKNDAGKLTLWHELIRPDLVVQDATKELIEAVRAATQVPVLYGNAG